jgi:hypothetical protein
MKKALLTLAAVAMASPAFAQGTITFFNNNIINPATGALYRAGIFQDSNLAVFGDPKGDSTVGAGAGFTAGLFLATDLNTALATVTFRTTSAQEVFAITQDVVVPGTPPNGSANLVVRAWSTAAGSYAAAAADSGANQWQFGQQAFASKALGGTNPNPPPPSFFTPDMAPFTGFEMDTNVPEPTTLALGAIGIGALLLRRRK